MKRVLLISLVILFCACEKLDESSTLICPVALEATNLTSNSFRANWTSSPSATIYRIQVAYNHDFSHLVKQIVVRGGNYVTIDNLSSSSEYFYRVRAEVLTFEKEYKSIYSNTISVIIP